MKRTWARILAGLLLLLVTTPARAADLASDLGDLDYERIDLDASTQGQPVARGRLGGRRTLFLVDTGFTFSAVVPERTKGLPALAPDAPQVPGSVLGLPHPLSVLFDRFSVGRRAFSDEPAQVIRLADPGGRAGALVLGRTDSFEADAVLGAWFLRRHRAVIDCTGPGLFVPRSTASPPAAVAERLRNRGYHPIPVYRFEVPGYVAPVEIGGATVPMLIDTGASLTMIDRTAARRATGVSVSPEPRRNLRGANGRQAMATLIQVPAFRLGSVRFTNAPVWVADLRAWNLGGTNQGPWVPQGVLGMDYLRHSRAVIDCGTPGFWLKPPR